MYFGITMSVNTNEYLNNDHLENLSQAYTLAYLRNNETRANNDSPLTTRWNYGKLEQRPVLRAQNNAIFIPHPTFTSLDGDAQDAAQSQAVSNNVHEGLVDAISFFIANHYQNLPSTQLNMAYYINHDDTHWTMLMATFSGLNQRQYQALFRAYQIYSHSTRENENLVGSEEQIAANRLANVKRYIKRERGITFNQTDENDELQLGNWVLPVECQNISMTHYDSYGKKSDETAMVRESAHAFLEANQANFIDGRCPKQKGNTCADWSANNAFRYGLLNNQPKSPIPSSKNLRKLSYNISTNNAHQILFSHKPNITKVAITDNISIYQPFASEQRRPAKNTFLNHFSPMTHLGAKIFFGALVAYAAFAFTPPIVAWVVGALSAYFLYDPLTKYIFGEKNLIPTKNKSGKVTVKNKRKKVGLLSKFFGVNAPYCKTLPDLEQEISSLLAPKNKTSTEQVKKQQVLTHYYAKQIIQKNPSCFYPSDKKVVGNRAYVDLKQVKKYLKPA